MAEDRAIPYRQCPVHVRVPYGPDTRVFFEHPPRRRPRVPNQRDEGATAFQACNTSADKAVDAPCACALPAPVHQPQPS